VVMLVANAKRCHQVLKFIVIVVGLEHNNCVVLEAALAPKRRTSNSSYDTNLFAIFRYNSSG
jgi:hypothetical protein